MFYSAFIEGCQNKISKIICPATTRDPCTTDTPVSFALLDGPTDRDPMAQADWAWDSGGDRIRVAEIFVYLEVQDTG